MKKGYEKKETPKMEQVHSVKFLKKALSMKQAKTIRKKAGKVMSAAGAAY